MMKAPAPSRARFLVGSTEVDGIEGVAAVDEVELMDAFAEEVVSIELVLLETGERENPAVREAGEAILNCKMLEEESIPRLALVLHF